MSAYWKHNDLERRWEFVVDDSIHSPRQVAYYADEFLARADVTRETIEEFTGFPGYPLPDEAFGAASSQVVPDSEAERDTR